MDCGGGQNHKSDPPLRETGRKDRQRRLRRSGRGWEPNAWGTVASVEGCEYLHRCHKKAKGVAKVAAARKLAVRLYWMLRTNTGYPEVVRVESSSRVALVSASLPG